MAMMTLTASMWSHGLSKDQPATPRRQHGCAGRRPQTEEDPYKKEEDDLLNVAKKTNRTTQPFSHRLI